MAWWQPITVTLTTVADLAWGNGIRDALRYLKGLDGPVDIEDSVTIDGNLTVTGITTVGSATGSSLRVPAITTTARDGLMPGNGWVIYNVTLNLFQRYENGGWVSANEVRLPQLTETARDALTPANGWMIYNSTDDVVERYEDGEWVSSIDLGAMRFSGGSQYSLVYLGPDGELTELSNGPPNTVLTATNGAPNWATSTERLLSVAIAHGAG